MASGAIIILMVWYSSWLWQFPEKASPEPIWNTLFRSAGICGLTPTVTTCLCSVYWKSRDFIFAESSFWKAEPNGWPIRKQRNKTWGQAYRLTPSFSFCLTGNRYVHPLFFTLFGSVCHRSAVGLSAEFPRHRQPSRYHLAAPIYYHTGQANV